MFYVGSTWSGSPALPFHIPQPWPGAPRPMMVRLASGACVRGVWQA